MTPIHPWSRAEGLRLAAESGFSPLDLSLGVPADPPPTPAGDSEVAAYPPSRGTVAFRTAAAGYLRRRFGALADPETVAATAGSKEFIATLPAFLNGLMPRRRGVVLIPELGYPTYAFGAQLAALEPVRVPTDTRGRMRVDAIPDPIRQRALCVWVNSPGNPTGVVEPLDEIAAWGRRHNVLVVSDEAYAELTWTHRPRSILEAGTDGVLAVHSLSKRSNAPGLRIGFYTGDPELVDVLVAQRREGGLIPSAAAQRAGGELLRDDRHAHAQRDRTRRRLADLVDLLRENGFRCPLPDGGMFAWVPVTGDDLTFARAAARCVGVLVAPGSRYGPNGAGHVRIAAVQDASRIADRLSLLTTVTGGLPA